MLACLFDAPPEVLQRIALFTVLATPLGPPRELYTLFQLCRKSHRIFCGNSSEFYADILTQKFDTVAVVRRLGVSTFRDNAKIELQRRFVALDIFRKGRLDDPLLTEAFWIAYLMVEDSTTSLKNVKQLLWADLPAFLNSFLRTRLYEGSVRNNGWPLSDVKNSLAIALFWHFSSQCESLLNFQCRGHSLLFQRQLTAKRLHRATRYCSSFLHSCLQHFGCVFTFSPLGFSIDNYTAQYPIFSTAENCFDLSVFHFCYTSATVHGPYPPPPLLPQDITYFGHVQHKARVPCASVYASLSYFSRHETMRPMIPPHLIKAERQTRVKADSLGQSGPTLDDVEHFIHECRTHFIDFSVISPRVQHLRSPLILGQPSSYRLGTLTGRWQGSYIVCHICIFPRSWHVYILSGAISRRL